MINVFRKLSVIPSGVPPTQLKKTRSFGLALVYESHQKGLRGLIVSVFFSKYGF